MSKFYDDLETMFADRGIVREDSFDYGVWWWDGEAGQSNQYRLTWIGPEWRKNGSDPGELYLVRLSPMRISPLRSTEIMTGDPHLGAIIQTGDASGAVELLCVIPPVPSSPDRFTTDGPHPDDNVEGILNGWAEICGSSRSVDWIRDQVAASIEAGWAHEA